MFDPKPLPAHLIGGNFSLTEIDLALGFTPEALSAEQRLMALTAEKCMDKEVRPNLEAFEPQQAPSSRSLIVNAKKLAPIVTGMAYPKSGEKHGNEQEVVAHVSDMVIDV